MKHSNYSHLWIAYKSRVDKGTISEVAKARIYFRRPTSIGFSSESLGVKSALKEIFVLKQVMNLDYGKDELLAIKDKMLFELGMEFLEAANNLNVNRVAEIAASGFNVNFMHPQYDHSLLHLVARSSSRKLLMAMLKGKEIDFLQKNGVGLLPSTIAEVYSRDPVIKRFFRMKEKQQASRDGINWEAYSKSAIKDEKVTLKEYAISMQLKL